MNLIFKIVYAILKWFSAVTGFSYNEINIIAYYIVIPLIFCHLFDKLFKVKYYKIGLAVVVIIALSIIQDFSSFSDKLFDKSVDFLKWFEVLGWNYIQASVIICVFLPAFIYFVLRYFVLRKNKP